MKKNSAFLASLFIDQLNKYFFANARKLTMDGVCFYYKKIAVINI